MDYVPAAGALVKVIHILSHYGELGHMLGRFGDSEMSTVWLRLQSLVPTPLVLPPHSEGAARKASLVASCAGLKCSQSPVKASLMSEYHSPLMHQPQ
jgi:hypothetical protein